MEQRIHLAQARHRVVDRGDLGPKSMRHLERIGCRTTPTPITTTLAAGTPGTPPSSTPRPPMGFSRYTAPT